MKQISLFVLILLTFGNLVLSEELKAATAIKTATSTAVKATEKRINIRPMSVINLPKNAQVYWEGWVKFFHYNNNTHYERPKAFFQNDEFFHQRIRKPNDRLKDHIGILRIPDRASFYLVLYNNSLTFYNTRQRTLMYAYDNLNIDYINMIPEDKLLNGGIKDLGDFEEGKCIEISAKIPVNTMKEFNPIYRGRFQNWVICNDEIKNKKKFFKTLIKLKLRRQRDFGHMATNDYLKRLYRNQKESVGTMLKRNTDSNRKSMSVQGPKDGYWILLNNWTKCTLKCGGGKSYQQWMCVPPKNGGKPCKGKSIKIRSCNTQKCPGVSITLDRLKKKKKEVVRPIVKVLPFSNRPQRYSKCMIKETDAYIMKTNEQGKTIAKQPVRLVMNNKTFSLFEDENYQNNMYTFQLKEMYFYRSKEWCCMQLKDEVKEFKVCGFEAMCGPRTKNEWVDEWDSAYQLFVRDCQAGITLLNPQDLKYLYGDMKDKLGQISADIENKKERILEEKLKEKNVRILGGRIKKMENLGFKVLKKELNIEMLLKKEEKQREQVELKGLFKKIRLEKKKKECMDKKIKERELEDKKLLDEREAEAEIKKKKKELSLDIELKRAELKRQIQYMRRRAKRKRAELEQKLQHIKSKMAGQAMKANKMGKISNCKRGKKNQKERDNYCNANFIEDFIKNSECKVEDQFCYTCCENEFGNMFLRKREECYDMCDENETKKKNKSKGSNKNGIVKGGRWIWVRHKPKSILKDIKK